MKKITDMQQILAWSADFKFLLGFDWDDVYCISKNGGGGPFEEIPECYTEEQAMEYFDQEIAKRKRN